MADNTFKRYEKKYILTKKQYDLLIPKLLKYMNYDEYCIDGKNYSIYTIYFDTENNDVIRYSISNPYYKEKLRLRSYHIPIESTDEVYLEIKKKINGIVSKRRAMFSFKEAEEFLKYRVRPKNDNFVNNQVIKEIEYYLDKNKVKPSVYMSYDRIAFYAKNNHDFRLTIDWNIKTRRDNIGIEKSSYGHELLKKNQYLMEIKILGAIPLWLTHIFTELKIYDIHFSKYGNEFIKYIEERYKRKYNCGVKKCWIQ